MARPRTRVRIPRSVKAGEPFPVRTRITHPMHTGLQRGRDGQLITRSIINHFTARFNGEEVISVTLEPAVSTDPYIQFEMTVTEAGNLEFEWQDDAGATFKQKKWVALR